jgi:hypothetical protein
MASGRVATVYLPSTRSGRTPQIHKRSWQRCHSIANGDRPGVARESAPREPLSHARTARAARLARQLGGDVTPAQAILIEEIAKKAIIVRAVGEFIMRQDSLVQGNRLLEVVTQHDRLSATLGSLIDRLGLERKTKEVRDLATYLAEKGDGSEKGEKVEKGADVVKGGGE